MLLLACMGCWELQQAGTLTDAQSRRKLCQANMLDVPLPLTTLSVYNYNTATATASVADMPGLDGLINCHNCYIYRDGFKLSAAVYIDTGYAAVTEISTDAWPRKKQRCMPCAPGETCSVLNGVLWVLHFVQQHVTQLSYQMLLQHLHCSGCPIGKIDRVGGTRSQT